MQSKAEAIHTSHDFYNQSELDLTSITIKNGRRNWFQ